METCSLMAVWDTLCKLSFTLLYFFFYFRSRRANGSAIIIIIIDPSCSLRKHPFLLALRRFFRAKRPQRRRARRNECFRRLSFLLSRCLCLFISCLISTFSADEDHDGSLDKMKTKVKVDHNGTNQWLAPLMLKSSCKINVRYFPFDEQVSLQLSKVLIWAIDIKNTVEVVVLFDLSTS